MNVIANGNTDPAVLGLRHDVDDNRGSLDTALRLAEWEQERGYASTFFFLHGSYYWPQVGGAAKEILALGHEPAIHVNAIAESIRQSRDPHAILTEALAEIREYVPITGAVAHGDQLCHLHGFVNDEIFVECARPTYGLPDRAVNDVLLAPRSMKEYGLDYDANWLSRETYLSDSGGSWSQSFDAVANGFPYKGQLHMLVHPDHWGAAFARQEVAA